MDYEKISELIDMLKGSFDVATKYAESDGRNNEKFDYEQKIHNEACNEIYDYVALLKARIDELKTERNYWRNKQVLKVMNEWETQRGARQ